LDIRNLNIDNIFAMPKPVFVEKETRCGFTTTINLRAKEKEFTTLMLVPYKTIYEEKKKEFRELNDAIYIGPNKDYCNATLDTDMPFATKREACWKCQEDCLVSQLIDSLENGGKHQIFMHYIKFSNLNINSILGQALFKYVDFFVPDECSAIISSSYKDYSWEDINLTGFDDIDEKIWQLRYLPVGDTIESFGLKNWYSRYQEEEESKERKKVGNVILMFSHNDFERIESGLRAYVDQENLMQWIEKCKSRFIFSEAGQEFEVFQNHLNINLHFYKWKDTMKKDTHYILVDSCKFDIGLIEHRFNVIKEISNAPPLTVFMSGKERKK